MRQFAPVLTLLLACAGGSPPDTEPVFDGVPPTDLSESSLARGGDHGTTDEQDKLALTAPPAIKASEAEVQQMESEIAMQVAHNTAHGRTIDRELLLRKIASSKPGPQLDDLIHHYVVATHHGSAQDAESAMKRLSMALVRRGSRLN